MSRLSRYPDISRHNQTYPNISGHPDISTCPNIHVVDSKSPPKAGGDSDSKSRCRPLSLRSSKHTHGRVLRHLPRLERAGAGRQALQGVEVQGGVRRPHQARQGGCGRRQQHSNIAPTASAGAARSSAELESLVALKLWEMFGIYGRREYDPDTLTSYEIRNGISADREKELAYLVYASWKEDANDVGRSTIAWVTLEEIVTALSDNELNVLDHFEENSTPTRCGLRRGLRSGSSTRATTTKTSEG